MSYREYIPSPLLSRYVDCYWHFITGRAGAGNQLPVQRCLPLGTIEIIVQVDCAPVDIFKNDGQWEKSSLIYFTGLYTDTVFWKAQPGTFLFGIRLKPESLMELFQLPGGFLLNKVADAEALLGKPAQQLFSEMMGVMHTDALIGIAEKYLLDRVKNLKTKRNYVADACRLIRYSKREWSVETLSSHLHISKRQLQRSFKEEFGASPKTYQRIIRFRNAYQYARSKNRENLKWSDVSYESGYSDQAHFIRDFKAFTGTPPSAIVHHPQSFFQTLEASPGILTC